MQKIKADQARERKNMSFCLLKIHETVKHPAHVHLISHSHCNVTCSAQDGQHCSCRVTGPSKLHSQDSRLIYEQDQSVQLKYVEMLSLHFVPQNFTSNDHF